MSENGIDAVITAPPPAAKSTTQLGEERLLAALAMLGETQVSQETLRFEGREFIIPATMDVDDALDFLSEYKRTQNEETEFSRTFKHRPWDGAYALQAALRKLTGTSGIPKATWSFFGGKEPPPLMTINIGPNKTEQVPWGVMEIPLVKGTLECGQRNNSELGLLFHLSINAPRRYRAQIEGLFKLVEKELEENSIYRGKAIDGQENAEFLNLDGVSADKVIYTEEVMTQLGANVWSLLEHTEKMREHNVPLKRAVLFEGEYGTGKTLGLHLTAQIAVENGWTAIYCRPERDDLNAVMGMARLYQPAVVLFEDVDAIASPGAEVDAVTGLLDTFDGINAKGTEILAVLTTNHKDRIHKGMVRPGRLDAVIHIGALDEDGLRRLIEATVPEQLIGSLDHKAIAVAMEGFLPAFAKEAIDRAIRYSLARHEGEAKILETADFVAAAEGLRPQLELMEGAGEKNARPTLDAEMERIATVAAKEAVKGAGFVEPGQGHEDRRFELTVPDGKKN